MNAVLSLDIMGHMTAVKFFLKFRWQHDIVGWRVFFIEFLLFSNNYKINIYMNNINKRFWTSTNKLLNRKTVWQICLTV